LEALIKSAIRGLFIYGLFTDTQIVLHRTTGY